MAERRARVAFAECPQRAGAVNEPAQSAGDTALHGRLSWVARAGGLGQRYARIRPLIAHSLTVIGIAYVALAISGNAGFGTCQAGATVACDAAAYYYSTPNLYDLYPLTPAYLYSPAFAWAFTPFRLLSFDAFVWVWAGLHVVALVWLRAGWMLAIPGVNEDVIRGNVGTFVAVATVLGIRYGAAWTPVLLSKVPTGIGFVWHAARGQWREVAWAIGLSASVALIGTIIAPDLWFGWVNTLVEAPATYGRADEGIPWPVRLVIGAVIVFYAARADRAWIVPIGVVIASAGISPPSLMKLAAIPRLRRWPRS